MIAKELAFNFVQAMAGCLADNESFLPSGVYQLHPHLEGGFCYLPNGKGGARTSVPVEFQVGGVPYIKRDEDEIFTALSMIFHHDNKLSSLSYLELELKLDGEVSFNVTEVWSQ